MNKRLLTLIIALSLTIGATGCSAKNTSVTSGKILSSITMTAGTAETIKDPDTFIELGDTVTINGSGATVENKKITINTAGTYSIKGTLSDGQIVVNAGDSDKVYLILNGVVINSTNSSPINVLNSDKTVISLVEGTENYIKDTSSTTTEEPNGAIFSKDDLVITGKGSLNVESTNNDGIASNDDLKIENGNITITSGDDGIKGKDSVVISGGNILINSKKDGIKSTNDTDVEKGYVFIQDGKVNITAVEDGISGEVNTLIKNGDITINTGGGSANGTKKDNLEQGRPGSQNTTTTTSEDTTSAKAIKAGLNVVIDGGTLNIDSSDDALHSENNLVINNGNFNISSGDDGIHSNSTLNINNGTIKILKSYEGLESENITIVDGEVSVNSSDDGFNASSGNASTNENPQEAGSGNEIINLKGGYITVNASGDGIDSNGSIEMTGGTVIVNGPTNNGNGALDYNGTFNITDGTLVAAGSAGMAQAPGTSSTLNSVKINLTQQKANTIINITAEDGSEVITFAPTKDYESVVISSPKIKTGSNYKVYLGGSYTSSAVDGLYKDGTYSNGSEVGSFKVSSSLSEVTQAGASNTNKMGGPGGRKAPRQ